MPEEFRSIRDNEYEACLGLWTTVFGEGLRSYFERYFYNDPSHRNEHTQVCMVDGEMVSAITFVIRDVAWGESTLRMGGVGNVATLPKMRGRGYNTECLRRITGVMEQADLDFGLLGTGINGYYERLGWETVAGWHISGEVTPPSSVANGNYSIRPFRAGDMTGICETYASFFGQVPGAVRRSQEYWNNWIGLTTTYSPTDTLVAQTGGTIRGYCAYKMEDLRCEISEIAARDLEDDAILALMRHVAAMGADRAVTKLDISAPANSRVLPAVQQVLGSAAVSRHEHSHAMVRLFSSDRLVTTLLPMLQKRWEAAGAPQGSVTWKSPYAGASRLKSAGDKLEVSIPASNHETAVTQSQLLMALAGDFTPVQLASEQARNLLKAIAVPGPAFYNWAWDGF